MTEEIFHGDARKIRKRSAFGYIPVLTAIFGFMKTTTILIPTKRGLTLGLYGVIGDKDAVLAGREKALATRYDIARGVVTVELPMLPAGQEITATLTDGQHADRGKGAHLENVKASI